MLQVGRIRKSKEFIVQTNNDSPHEVSTKTWPKVVTIKQGDPEKPLTDLEALFEESETRRECMEEKWEKLKRRRRAKLDENTTAVREERLKEWVRQYPVRLSW